MPALAPPLASAITAQLGPTNTGKTHRAIERMLEHDTGIIGLPLRLLAREVYDRIERRVGSDDVALVTGEEKRIPRRPRYWVCTVEAMPTEIEADFLAVDEVQLLDHRQRGHVFTERLMRARGRLETWFLGADTVIPLMRTVLPTARIVRHPRLSHLTYRGSSSIGSLPPRSAVVGFSVPQVYELADAVRRRHGGAAVVLGALSPRARNAQVALFESGEVDYLVATDAIGMGLNLDVDHVALASLRKFDGHEERDVTPAELGQIVGRAGRFLRDGTFGTLKQVPDLPSPLVRALEEHRFSAVQKGLWRNPDPDYASVASLVASLRERPPIACLTLMVEAEDFEALQRVALREEVLERAQTDAQVRLLWETCQIPDFRKLLPEAHAGLVLDVFLELSRSGQLDNDWMADRVDSIDDVEGDIATLTARLAMIRTWTYVSSHGQWVRDGFAWRERTRDVEDRLSEALHRRLVQRFVDREARKARHTRKRPRRPGVPDGPAAEIDPNSPFAALAQLAARLGATEPARSGSNLASDIDGATADAFDVAPTGIISFRGEPVGRLRAGRDVLRPEVTVTSEIIETGTERQRVALKLRDVTHELVRCTTEPLGEEDTSQLSGPARGLLYQLERGLGTVLARDAVEQVRALTQADRLILERGGIVIGRHVIYSRPSLRHGMVRRRVALCQAYLGSAVRLEPPEDRTLSFRAWKGVAPEVHVAVGFPTLGDRAIRADAIERASAMLAHAARGGVFRPPRRLSTALGCDTDALPDIVERLGYRYVGDGRYVGRQRRRRRRQKASVADK